MDCRRDNNDACPAADFRSVNGNNLGNRTGAGALARSSRPSNRQYIVAPVPKEQPPVHHPGQPVAPGSQATREAWIDREESRSRRALNSRRGLEQARSIGADFSRPSKTAKVVFPSSTTPANSVRAGLAKIRASLGRAFDFQTTSRFPPNRRKSPARFGRSAKRKGREIPERGQRSKAPSSRGVVGRTAQRQGPAFFVLPVQGQQFPGLAQGDLIAPQQPIGAAENPQPAPAGAHVPESRSTSKVESAAAPANPAIRRREDGCQERVEKSGRRRPVRQSLLALIAAAFPAEKRQIGVLDAAIQRPSGEQAREPNGPSEGRGAPGSQGVGPGRPRKERPPRGLRVPSRQVLTGSNSRQPEKISEEKNYGKNGKKLK